MLNPAKTITARAAWSKTNWRSCKKHENAMCHPCYVARQIGEDHAYRFKPNRNPYPPGLRHDAYEDGYNTTTQDFREYYGGNGRH